MKELRVQHEGHSYRILFAFDPQRNAYLILGGDKQVPHVDMRSMFRKPTRSTADI
jgi:hypothetical protein